MFWSQYTSSYANSFVWPGKQWMAILNLIFALAAKHSQLVQEGAKDLQEVRNQRSGRPEGSQSPAGPDYWVEGTARCVRSYPWDQC